MIIQIQFTHETRKRLLVAGKEVGKYGAINVDLEALSVDDRKTLAEITKYAQDQNLCSGEFLLLEERSAVEHMLMSSDEHFFDAALLVSDEQAALVDYLAKVRAVQALRQAERERKEAAEKARIQAQREEMLAAIAAYEAGEERYNLLDDGCLDARFKGHRCHNENRDVLDLMADYVAEQKAARRAEWQLERDAREAKEREKEAALQAKVEALKAWALEHGSDKLKKRIAGEFNWRTLALREKLVSLLPAGDWQPVNTAADCYERENPEEDEMDKLAEVKAAVGEGVTVELCLLKSSDEDYEVADSQVVIRASHDFLGVSSTEMELFVKEL